MDLDMTLKIVLLAFSAGGAFMALRIDGRITALREKFTDGMDAVHKRIDDMYKREASR